MGEDTILMNYCYSLILEGLDQATSKDTYVIFLRFIALVQIYI